MTFLRILGAVTFLTATAVACSSSSSTTGGACHTAGGTCVLGPGLTCATEAATSAQDCNSAPTPGGQICCLAFTDAGSVGGDAGSVGSPDGAAPSDAAPSDAASNEDAFGSADGDSALTCAQRTSAASSAAFAASSKDDTTCASDSDCVVADNSSICWNGCGVVLSKSGAAQLAATIAQINATICAEFKADGCTANSPPPCAAHLPKCTNGVCGG